jgi:hypothetical protein
MPSWNLGEIASATTTALGNRSDIALSAVSFWANVAQQQVWDVLPHDLQEGLAVSSSTSGENRITWPTDYQELLTLSNLSRSGVELRPLNLGEANSWTTERGDPTHFVQFSDWLELYPTPDSAHSLQLRYRRQLSDMTVVGSVPSVATRYRPAVFAKTKELVARHVILDANAATAALGEYLAYMSSMPNDRALRAREDRFRGLSLARSVKQSPTGATSYDFDTNDA